MACTISVSKQSSDIWMIKNSIYCEFIDIISKTESVDPAIVKELEQSIYVNGIALEIIEDRTFARKTAEVIEAIAVRIANGEVHLESINSFNMSFREETKDLFRELAELLKAWRFSN